MIVISEGSLPISPARASRIFRDVSSSSGDILVLSSSGDTDASHVLFALPNGTDVGGSCIIEPAVLCNHCGYCKSYGH